MGADYPKNPWEKRKDISVTKTIRGCIGEIQGFTAAQKKNRLEVRGPLVPYRTSSLRAKRRPPLSLSFFHSAYLCNLCTPEVLEYTRLIQLTEGTYHNCWQCSELLWTHNLYIQIIRLVHRGRQHSRASQDQEAATLKLADPRSPANNHSWSNGGQHCCA